MKKRGGRVLAVSVDAPERSRDVVKQQKLGFHILADVNADAIRSFGILHQGAGEGGRDLSLPAQFLIDREGVVRWARVAATIVDRPDPRDVLTRIRELEPR